MGEFKLGEFDLRPDFVLPSDKDFKRGEIVLKMNERMLWTVIIPREMKHTYQWVLEELNRNEEVW